MANDVHLEADFTLNTQPDMQADFIIETGRVQADFKDITGDPYNNSALAEALNQKADNSTVEELSENVDLKLSALGAKVKNDINALEVEIDNLTTVVGDNYNSLDNKIDSTWTAIENEISALETDLNGKINEEQSARIEADNTLQGNIDTLDNKIDTHIADKANPHEVTKVQVGLGNVDNTSDLDKPISTATQTALNGKQNTINDLSEIRSNAGNGQSAYNTIQNYGDIVTYNASSFATNLQGQKADTALQPNDDISELNNDVGYITSASLPTVNNSTITFQKNNVTVGDINLNQADNETINFEIPTKASDVNALPDTTTINDLTTTAQQNAINSGATSDNIGQIATNTSNLNSLQTTVTNNYNTLDGRITSEVSALNTAITTENTQRQTADSNLQSQIDAIVTAKDVTDIVGTYTELLDYDTSSLAINSIIKVLVDSTHDNASSYYEWNGTSWTYKGSEGPYATPDYVQANFVNKSTTVNGKALSNNITLTATDVGALPSSTVIGNGVLTIQNNGVDVDSFNANATNNKTINLVTPTKTSDLVNDSGFIDNSGLSNLVTQTDLTDGLATKQDKISDLSTIRQNAQNGQSAYTTIGSYGDIVTYNASNFATSAQGSKADTALQQGNNISLLNNNSGFITGITGPDVTSALGYTPYNSTNPNGYTSNIGTVTSVNNTTPDVNGNVTISVSGGANTDLSNLTATGEAHFQEPLVSGTNIKTVNNTSLLGSGNIDTSEIFIAEYGVTSYADVLAAYNAGKTIICQYESNITSSPKIIYNLYLINFATNTTFNFSGTISGTAQYFYTNLTSSGWASVSNKTCETTSNKVTSISSSSTDTQYPSAKLLYDQLALKQNTSTAVTHTANTSVGSSTTPVYINSSGVATSTGLSIASSRFDGQWIPRWARVFNSTSIQSTSYDLANYLPSDYTSEAYEIYGSLYLSSDASTQLTVGRVSSPYINVETGTRTDDNFGATAGTHSNCRRAFRSFILVMGYCYSSHSSTTKSSHRYLYCQVTGTKASGYATVELLGFRRIGTNL